MNKGHPVKDAFDFRRKMSHSASTFCFPLLVSNGLFSAAKAQQALHENNIWKNAKKYPVILQSRQSLAAPARVQQAQLGTDPEKMR